MADLGQVPFVDFAIALFIGALVGIEREKKQVEGEAESGRGIGGLRTFILFSLAGAVAASLSHRLDAPWIFLGAGALVTAVVVAGYVSYTRAMRRSYGITTEIAAVVVFLLGGTAVVGEPGLAVALGIATSAVLAFKAPLHGVVERLGRDDIYAGLKLLIASFIVLPLLPDRTVDPWDALNPWRMGWLVVLISGLSLVGYAATRWLGADRGIVLTGLFGGLVSSTAVTLSFARRSVEKAGAEKLVGPLAAGILVAWGIMFVRVVVLCVAVNPALVPSLAVPMAALAALCAGLGVAAWRDGAQASAAAHEDVPLRNPFSLTAAIRFALLFGVVLLVVKLVQTHVPGRSSLYLVAGLAGATDVDAITLSLAEVAHGRADPRVPVQGIVIAAASNTLVKCGLVVGLGAPALRRRILLATAVLAAVAAGALALA